MNLEMPNYHNTANATSKAPRAGGAWDKGGPVTTLNNMKAHEGKVLYSSLWAREGGSQGGAVLNMSQMQADLQDTGSWQGCGLGDLGLAQWGAEVSTVAGFSPVVSPSIDGI